jgi:hypothetical protein
MADMQMCESSYELLAGDPLCAPSTAVMVEANVMVFNGSFNNISVISL